MSKNKKPRAEAISEAEGLERLGALAGADPDEVKRYLEMLDISEPIQDEAEKRIYAYTRRKLAESLNANHQTNILFGALIERIARTILLLQKLDKVQVASLIPVSSMTIGEKTIDYIKLQQEHRATVEAFANMRFACEKIGGKKTLEEIRRIITQ